MATKVRVPARFRIGVASYNGLGVKEAFYVPEAKVGEHPPLDEMYVLHSQQFGLSKDVLLRTGAGFARLSQEIYGVLGVLEEGGFMVYNTEPLSPDDEVRVLSVMRTKEIIG